MMPEWDCCFCGEKVYMTFYLIPMCKICQEKFWKVHERVITEDELGKQPSSGDAPDSETPEPKGKEETGDPENYIHYVPWSKEKTVCGSHSKTIRFTSNSGLVNCPACLGRDEEQDTTKGKEIIEQRKTCSSCGKENVWTATFNVLYWLCDKCKEFNGPGPKDTVEVEAEVGDVNVPVGKITEQGRGGRGIGG